MNRSVNIDKKLKNKEPNNKESNFIFDISMFCVYIYENGDVLPGQPPKFIVFEHANGKIEKIPYSHNILLRQINEWCILAEKMIETGNHVKNCKTLLKDYVRDGIIYATMTLMNKKIPGLVQVYITFNNKIGGVIGLSPTVWPLEKCTISSFIINPKLYRQGVGTKLFTILKNTHIEKEICKGFYICACSSSILFWEKQGFQQEDVKYLRKHCKEINTIEDTIIMSITF